MIVKKCMTEKVELGSPNMTLLDAAKKMRDGDFGILPIEENDKLIGIITDRDIAVRGVAEGLDPKKVKVSEIMTDRVLYCYEDQSLDEVAQNLGENRIRRLPVLNRKKRLVGILSLGDLAQSHLNPKQLEITLSRLSKHTNDFSETTFQ
ncbi:MAG: CBS domain-containing protein [Bacteriovorax sp.]|nr:CBS domain-containing protein [Bacteriovorax sp.]